MNTMKKCSTCGTLFSGDLCPKCMAGFAQNPTAPTQPPEELPLKPGQTFHGMEVLELLGKGGMGVVYKARQPTLDRLVALKILPAKLARDPDFQNRFIREAKALGALNHPNIVAVYDFGAEGELFFFAMEFVDGTNLRQILRDRKLTSQQALKLVPQLCDALEYAHEEGVVHRDIKPENILLDKKGRVKIADFGLAKLIGADVAAAGALTLTNMVMGTPHYMAPEQVENPKSVDHRADIYSIGVVFYEMLTGELPIGRFEVPSKKVQIDVRLDEVVLKALEKAPDRRYQKASDVKDAVTRATAVASTDAYSPTIMTPVPAQKGGSRALVALGILAGVAVAVAVLAIVTRPKYPVPPAPVPAVVVTPPAPAAPEPVDLTRLYFGLEERPLHYAFQQAGKGLPRNPFPAREAEDLQTLIENLDAVGLQNIERTDLKQGYLAAWFRWEAAFVALETTVAERIETAFRGLSRLENRWSHRKGNLLILAWVPRRERRDLFEDLVGRLQKKLGLPEEPPELALPNLQFEPSSGILGLTPTAAALSERTSPFLCQQTQRFLNEKNQAVIDVQAHQFQTIDDAKGKETRLLAEFQGLGLRQSDLLRVGRTVVALSLHTEAIGAYVRVREHLREWLGLPKRVFDTLLLRTGELPPGYTLGTIESSIPAVLEEYQFQGVPPAHVLRAWRATFKPAGRVVLLETQENADRSALENHLQKRGGPAAYLDHFVFGVEGPDDETLDALENRMREKFGWDPNRPRPLHLLQARLRAGDLPQGLAMASETIDRSNFSCEIKGQDFSLNCKIRETHDYGLLEKVRKEMGSVPGDLLLIKDTVVVFVGGGGEKSWAAIDQIESALRKKMRLGPPGADEFALRAWELPAGSTYLDRPGTISPNPREGKPTTPEVESVWEALVDPSETHLRVYQLKDARAAEAFDTLLQKAALPEGKPVVLRKGTIVIALTPEGPRDEAALKALGDRMRAKLRLAGP